MLKDAVIIIADHGVHYGHGGDSMEELQIPVSCMERCYKGSSAHANMIYDCSYRCRASRELPRQSRFMQGIEPKPIRYVPVHDSPFKGVVDKVKVTITVDTEGAEIYYTLDGTAPMKESIRTPIV